MLIRFKESTDEACTSGTDSVVDHASAKDVDRL